MRVQIERKSVNGSEFIRMIGFDTYEQSFKTSANELSFVEVSSAKLSGEYNVQLFNQKNRMIEAKRIRKNSDIGLMIESRLFD